MSGSDVAVEAVVTISREQENRLRAIAPSYLQKDRHQSQRVRWGLETLFELLERAGGVNAGPERKPKARSDDGQ